MLFSPDWLFLILNLFPHAYLCKNAPMITFIFRDNFNTGLQVLSHWKFIQFKRTYGGTLSDPNFLPPLFAPFRLTERGTANNGRRLRRRGRGLLLVRRARAAVNNIKALGD